MPRLIPTEYEECVALYDYVRYKPHIGDFLIHLPNEGKRSIRYGQKLLNIGLRPGVPDYVYPVPNHLWHSLWFEMKRQYTQHRAKNPNQDLWINRLRSVGHYACYAYGAEHAISLLNDYIANRF